MADAVVLETLRAKVAAVRPAAGGNLVELSADSSALRVGLIGTDGAHNAQGEQAVGVADVAVDACHEVDMLHLRRGDGVQELL